MTVTEAELLTDPKAQPRSFFNLAKSLLSLICTPTVCRSGAGSLNRLSSQGCPPNLECVFVGWSFLYMSCGHRFYEVAFPLCSKSGEDEKKVVRVVSYRTQVTSF